MGTGGPGLEAGLTASPSRALQPQSPGPRPQHYVSLGDQVEDWQIHRDHDAADDDAEHGDHDRIEQRQQAGDGRVDFLLVEVGNLREHRIERAGRLADADHLRDHRRKDVRLLERR